MGATIAVYSNRPFPDAIYRVSYWLAIMLTAVYAYIFIVFFFGKVVKKPFKAQIREHWPYTGIGFIVIYIISIARSFFLYAYGTGAETTFQSIHLLSQGNNVAALFHVALQTAGMLLLGEVIFYGTGYSQLMARMVDPEADQKVLNPKPPLHEGAEGDENQVITMGTGIEQQLIPVKAISHITVENHFSTLTYQEISEWKQCGAYTSLAEFEAQCPTFIRINRSTLINPGHVCKIKRSGRQYNVHMQCEPEAALTISRSKSHLTKQISDLINRKTIKETAGLSQ